MKTSFWATLALALATTTAAHAGDDWSGFYVGFETGIARNVVKDRDHWPATYDQVGSSTGVMAGIFAGYDQQFGDLVFGGLADIDYVGTKDIVFNGKTDTSYDMNWVATARVRGGWAANDKLLVYGTGGVSIAGAKGSLPGMLGSSLPMKSTQAGYAVGLGAEYRLNASWTIKAEYLHHDFGKVTNAQTTATLKPRLHMFKIGIAYRF